MRNSASFMDHSLRFLEKWTCIVAFAGKLRQKRRSAVNRTPWLRARASVTRVIRTPCGVASHARALPRQASVRTPCNSLASRACQRDARDPHAVVVARGSSPRGPCGICTPCGIRTRPPAVRVGSRPRLVRRRRGSGIVVPNHGNHENSEKMAARLACA